jgi:hypothetical protein
MSWLSQKRENNYLPFHIITLERSSSIFMWGPFFLGTVWRQSL